MPSSELDRRSRSCFARISKISSRTLNTLRRTTQMNIHVLGWNEGGDLKWKGSKENVCTSNDNPYAAVAGFNFNARKIGGSCLLISSYIMLRRSAC